MRTIGLLGGMSWESTRQYYHIINMGVRKRLGGLHSAKILMQSFDFAEIAAMQHAGKWDELGEILLSAAKRLEEAGAEGIMICTNLMHKVAPQIEARLAVPLLHIGDAVADAILAQGHKKVALLGAKYTMSDSFYREHLGNRGIEVVVPSGSAFHQVNKMIYDELCQGKLVPESKKRLLQIISDLQAKNGAKGVILGCTELPLLVSAKDTNVPLYDTTKLHAIMALKWIFEGAEQTRQAS